MSESGLELFGSELGPFCSKSRRRKTVSRVTVQLLASHDDLLIVMAAAIVHKVFRDTDAVSIHKQGRECHLY